MDFQALGKEINRFEPETVFTITDSGTADVVGVYAPEVQNNPDGDISIGSYGWEAITGMTGQYGYCGSMMHPSEFIGADMAERLTVIADRGDGSVTQFAYVLVYSDEPNDDDEYEPCGWTIVYRHVSE